MITKRIVLCILFFLIVRAVSCQILDTAKIESFFDVDTTCLGTFFKTNGRIDSTVYIDLNKNKIDVLFTLPKYEYGYDSLRLYLLGQIEKEPDYEEISGASALVYILIECDRIREIRIRKRYGYNCKFDGIIKETLMKTQGKWIIPKVDKRKPVLFIYLFKM